MIVESRITTCDPQLALGYLCSAAESAFGRQLTMAEAKIYFGASSHEAARFTRLPNNNPAGLKPGKAWTGDVALHRTHEVKDGVSVPVDAEFRAYPTLQAGFFDCFKSVLIPGYPEAVKGAEMGDPEAYVRGLWQGWGHGAHYFTGSPDDYLAGMWREIRFLDSLAIDWTQMTSARRLPPGGSPSS